MSSESRKRLADYARAVLGIDQRGNGTCEICGRTGVKVLRKSSVSRTTKELVGRVWLCGPCLKDDFVSDVKSGDTGNRLDGIGD